MKTSWLVPFRPLAVPSGSAGAFSTTRFLDGFRADPAVGRLSVSLLVPQDTAAPSSEYLLAQANAASFYETALTMTVDAGMIPLPAPVSAGEEPRIMRHKRISEPLPRSDEFQSRPLPGDPDWTLNSYRRSERPVSVMEGGLVQVLPASLSLHHRDGRSLSLDVEGDKAGISVGWRSEHGQVSLAAGVRGQGLDRFEYTLAGWHFGFRDAAIAGLLQFLGVERSKKTLLVDLAVALARHSFGLYGDEELSHGWLLVTEGSRVPVELVNPSNPSGPNQTDREHAEASGFFQLETAQLDPSAPRSGGGGTPFVRIMGITSRHTGSEQRILRMDLSPRVAQKKDSMPLVGRLLDLAYWIIGRDETTA